MILDWLTPILEWTGLTIIPFLLILLIIVLILKD